jgi:hypothetical protein
MQLSQAMCSSSCFLPLPMHFHPFFFFFALPASEASVTSTMIRRRRPHMILRSDGELILVPVTA